MWSVCRPCLTTQVHPNFIQSWLPQNALFSIFCAGSSISMEYPLLLCPDQLLLLLFIVIIVPWSIFRSPSQGSATTCFWDILERRFHTKYPLFPPGKNFIISEKNFLFFCNISDFTSAASSHSSSPSTPRALKSPLKMKKNEETWFCLVGPV